MSADDTVEISKDLLRRVMAEVEELRADAAQAKATASASQETLDEANRHADAMRTAAETATKERDAARETAAEARKTEDTASGAAAERDRLRHELASLRRDHEALQAEHAALLRTHPAPPTRASVPDDPGAPADSDQAALARAFVAWCRRGSPLVSRSYLFAAFVREASGRPCTVRPVFRDRSEPTPTFTERPAAGSEYWLVAVGDLHALVPQPTSPRAFAETAPAFDGESTPDRLASLSPATPDGLETPFGLTRRGELS